jgi:hypothetical protein
MKQTLTKLIALVGLAAFLVSGCATTGNNDRPAPTPEEIAVIVAPSVNYLTFKLESENPDLVPYLRAVGSAVREFSESGELDPVRLASLLKDSLIEAGVLDLDPDDAALVELISQTALNLYSLYYGRTYQVEDRPAWLEAVLLVIADAFDPQV